MILISDPAMTLLMLKMDPNLENEIFDIFRVKFDLTPQRTGSALGNHFRKRNFNKKRLFLSMSIGINMCPIWADLPKVSK